MKHADKQEWRKERKAALRADLDAKGKEAVLSSIVPRLMSKEERRKETAEKKKRQQKTKPSALRKKVNPKKGSLKFKPSVFLKKGLSRKPSIKGKPSAKKKQERKRAEDHARSKAWDSMKAAVERLNKVADLHGIKRKPGKPPGSAKVAKNLLGSLDAVADSPSSKAEEEILKIFSLAKQLEQDLARTEVREVAYLEAALQQEKLKVKNTQEGKNFQKNLAEVEKLLEQMRKMAEEAPEKVKEGEQVEESKPAEESKQAEESKPGKRALPAAEAGLQPLPEPDYPPPAELPPPSGSGPPVLLPQPSGSGREEVPALVSLGANREEVAARAAGSGGEQEEKIYVIVAHELATKELKGKRGNLIKKKGDQAEFLPMEGGLAKWCPLEWLVCIDELEAKTAPCQAKKPCTWLDASLAEKILNTMTFKPAEPVPDGDFTYELFAENVDSGIAEILYRLLPGTGFVVVPASLANFLLTFAGRPSDYAERYDETQKLKMELYNRVEKGRVVCIPIQSGGHWTLLILERKSVAPGSAGTKATNPLGATDAGVRKAAERNQFAMESWPIIPSFLDEVWEMRYIDSLQPCILSCKTQAKFMLELLFSAGYGTFPDSSLLTIHNKLFQQDAINCGYFLLHYLEEEVRAFLGERRGTQNLDLAHRRERINAMQSALKLRAKPDKKKS